MENSLDEIFEQLYSSHNIGQLEILEIKNYRGPNGKPYVDDSRLLELFLPKLDNKSLVMHLAKI